MHIIYRNVCCGDSNVFSLHTGYYRVQNMATLLYSFHECEHPVVAQLGGNQVDYLQKAAKMLEEKGYDEINFNCGCPSNTVSVSS